MTSAAPLSILYSVSGGCGSTSLRGTLKDGKFHLKYHSNWMGYEKPIKYSIIGTYVYNAPLTYRLIVGKIEKNEPGNNKMIFEYIKESIMDFIYLDLYLFSHSLDFEKGSSEHESIVMGRCKINKDYTYNAVLLCDAYFHADTKETKKILNCIDKCKCHVDNEDMDMNDTDVKDTVQGVTGDDGVVEGEGDGW